MWALHERLHQRHVVQAALRFFAAALLLAISFPSQAAERLLGDSSLGRWIEHSAGAALSDALANHPRFRGETIRLVSLENGRPAHRSNRLNQAIRAELNRVLLRRDGVRIAWDAPADPCAPPRDINYLLGVEIERAGYEYRVNVAMVDVHEGVWVSGMNHTWEGRLSSAERKASALAVSTSPNGSLGNPLPLVDDAAIVAALSKRMTCRLPELDRPLHVRSPDDRALTRIADGVENALALSARADLARDPAAADWIVLLDLQSTGVETGQVLVQLQAADDPTQTQTLASVYVRKPGTQVARGVARSRAPTTAPAPQTGVLGPLAYGGVCTGNERSACIQVEFELYKPAHLLLFHTRDGLLKLAGCSTTTRRRQPGQHLFRLNVPRGGSAEQRPDFGFYALAVEDRNVARQLQSVLRRAPGVCGERDGSMNAWLGQLDTVLARHGDDVHWQAYHLVHTPSGLATL